jgi:hypothetical protein
MVNCKGLVRKFFEAISLAFTRTEENHVRMAGAFARIQTGYLLTIIQKNYYVGCPACYTALTYSFKWG